MAARDVLLELMTNFESKVQAFQEALPPGSVLDPEDPACIAMIQSLKATNAGLVQVEAELDGEVDELIQELTQQHQEASKEAADAAAVAATVEEQEQGRIKAIMDKISKPGLPTLPFEQAHAPKADRLQHLITRLSQIAKCPAVNPRT